LLSRFFYYLYFLRYRSPVNFLLHKQGFQFLLPLDIPAFTSYSSDLVGTPRGTLLTQPFHRPLSPTQVTNFDFSLSSILNSPALTSIIFSYDLITQLRSHLGPNFFISGINSWVTYGNTSDHSLNAMSWHVDFDRLLETKVFIFLFDTSPGSGFQYLPSSHMLSPTPDNFSQRITDLHPIQPVTLDGQSGEVLLAFTWGSHRDAPPPVPGPAKAVLQLQLAITPIGYSHLTHPYFPVPHSLYSQINLLPPSYHSHFRLLRSY